MLHLFDGLDANTVWLKAVKSVLAEPVSIQNTRLGESKELLHSSFHVENPRQRWISARTPCISPAFAIAEVFWILNGSNQASFINFWNPSLPKFAGDGHTYHGAYGHRIR